MSARIQASDRANDRDACAREPIHVPASIQPDGVLLVVDGEELIVRAVSQTVEMYLGRSPASVLERPLADLTGHALAASLRALANTPRLNRQVVLFDELVGGPNHARFDAAAHRHAGRLILELEHGAALSDFDSANMPDRTLNFTTRLQEARNAQALYAVLVREMRALTGFDRVLLYRFDEEWNGTVVAEERNDELPSYLDLRFPASDVPAQARELYRLQRSRLIGRSHYVPSPLICAPSAPPAHEIDLTYSILRSVSPVHLEYMRNMGTAASMSFSILHQGQLWGLLSCHHATPRRCSYSVRRLGEVLCEIFSLQLSAMERENEAQHLRELGRVRSELLVAMSSAEDFTRALEQHSDELLLCVAATGAAICTDSGVRLVGATPPAPAIAELVAWLQTQQPADLFYTDRLGDEYSPAASYSDVASGLMAVAISKLHPSYLMWFRRELAHTVTWAGEPRKYFPPHLAHGEALHPRQSFAAWKEIVQGRSARWRSSEIDTARALRNDIVGVVLRKAEELGAINEQLHRTNEELESFSYSVSHDLRAPLRHVVGYAQLTLRGEEDRLTDKGRRYLENVIEAAIYAGKLVDGLLALSQLGRAALTPAKVDMNALVDAAWLDLAPEVQGRKVQWSRGDLPAVEGDRALLRVVLDNLLLNALKYSATRDPAKIAVDGWVGEQEAVYRVSDNGVGFDMAYVGKLFGAFQRLHRVEDFAGLGIGLANVRRIVTRHGGRVWAEGRVDAGATFYFSLPMLGK